MTGVLRFYERGRYLLVRAFGCPMPGLSSFIPFIGGRTAFEVIVFIFSFFACISKAVEDAEGVAGQTMDKLIFVTVMLAMRNNPLMIVFGMSFERAIYVHKAFGLITFGVMCIHATTGFNPTGIVLLISIVTVVASYLVKNYNFELFYFSHIAAYLAIVITAILHGGSMATMSIMFFGADVIVRYLIRGRTVKATAKLLPGDVIKITFPKCFEYDAGQFVFLRIGELSPVEYHPFSICSSPLEKDVVISIRALGDWTRRLAKMAEQAGKIELEIQVEGPFGNASIDLYGPDYQVLHIILNAL
jgi:predicted ferric reductase